MNSWRGGVVRVLSCLGKEDDEDDEEDNPSVALINQDSLETDEGDQCGDYCQDDNTNDEGNVTVGDSSQCKTTCDASNSRPADLDNGVKSCDDFVGPPSESISADRDYKPSVMRLIHRTLPGMQRLTLSQTSRCTKSCCKASSCATENRGEDDDDNGLAKGYSKSGLNHYTDVCEFKATYSGRTPIPAFRSRNRKCSLFHWPTGKTCSAVASRAHDPCPLATFW